MLQKNALLSALFFLGLAAQSNAYGSAAEDEHIRQIVQGILKEKDQKIQQFEARIRQLEQELDKRQTTFQHHQNFALPSETITPETTHSEPTKTVANDKGESTVSSKLHELDKKIDELKESAAENGLDISGFFDVNAKTGNVTDKTFSVGTVELDMDYAYDDHFGASTALEFSGEDTTSEIAVALIDFHSFNDRIPPRGRLFNNQGFHLQAGRFDVPFGIDYQYFANKDRVTVTAPITTTRLQRDGYNGDGVRSYGSWDIFNYSVFWTNALYADDGYTVGGRLGMNLGQRRYSVHNPQQGIEFGISHLSEFNGNSRLRHTVYGADLSVSYGMLRWQNEFMLLQAHQSLMLDGEMVHDDFDNPIGKAHQLGYHSTLIANLEDLIKYPVSVFARYGLWKPKRSFGLDTDGSVVAVDDVSMLSIGFNYKFTDHLQLKFEYSDSLGTSTKEHHFDKKMGIGQMVISF